MTILNANQQDCLNVLDDVRERILDGHVDSIAITACDSGLGWVKAYGGGRPAELFMALWDLMNDIWRATVTSTPKPISKIMRVS